MSGLLTRKAKRRGGANVTKTSRCIMPYNIRRFWDLINEILTNKIKPNDSYPI